MELSQCHLVAQSHCRRYMQQSQNQDQDFFKGRIILLSHCRIVALSQIQQSQCQYQDFCVSIELSHCRIVALPHYRRYSSLKVIFRIFIYVQNYLILAWSHYRIVALSQIQVSHCCLVASSQIQQSQSQNQDLCLSIELTQCHIVALSHCRRYSGLKVRIRICV